MTEAEWLASGEPVAMLKVVCERADERKIRLFALAGCRRIEHLLTTPHEERSRAAIAVLERRIEGTANESELQSALSAMVGDMFGNVRNPGDADGYALDTAIDVVYRVRQGGWGGVTESVSEAIAYEVLARSGSRELERIDLRWRQRRVDGFPWEEDEDAVRALPEYLAAMKVERSNQATLLREIFGNPFRPATFSPEWRTDTVLALARRMYESREFSAMPILADALQDAGCENDDILAHCRDANQPHVRGCWVVDLVLGKE